MDEKATQARIAASARALLGAFQGRQADLAGALGISQVAVSRRLAGTARWTPTEVEKVAAHFGVRVEQVLAGPRAWLGLDADEGGPAPALSAA